MSRHMVDAIDHTILRNKKKSSLKQIDFLKRKRKTCFVVVMAVLDKCLATQHYSLKLKPSSLWSSKESVRNLTWRKRTCIQHKEARRRLVCKRQNLGRTQMSIIKRMNKQLWQWYCKGMLYSEQKFKTMCINTNLKNTSLSENGN